MVNALQEPMQKTRSRVRTNATSVPQGGGPIAKGWIDPMTARCVVLEPTTRRRDAPQVSRYYSSFMLCSFMLTDLFFDNEKNLAVCDPCPQGKYLLSQCGSAVDHNQADSCRVCGIDTYQDEMGKFSCKACGKGLKILDEAKFADQHLNAEACSDPSKIPTVEDVWVSRPIEPPLVLISNYSDVVVENPEYNYAGNISWSFLPDTNFDAVVSFEIEISDVDTFLGDDVHFMTKISKEVSSVSFDHTTFTSGNNKRRLSTCKENCIVSKSATALSNASLILLRPLWHTVIFARIRSVGVLDIKGPWSKITSTWQTGKDCTDNFYLETAPVKIREWTCSSCPEGADCTAAAPYFGVKSQMGYNRQEGVNRTFFECLYQGACLGGPNSNLKGKFLDATDKSYDYSEQDLPEQCNADLGFLDGSRLCHSCKKNWRRLSRDECAECGNEGSNWLLMLFGCLVIVACLVALVLNTIKSAGRTTVSESVQKIIINYLQVAALFGNFPLRWPAAITSLFNIQGGFSTLGENFVNPDCISAVGMASEAELHYSKQIGYFLLPWALVLSSFGIWKLYARLKGISFNVRVIKSKTGEALHVLTPKDKMVVSFCVLIYLLYPTLCSQGFALFNCIRIGNDFYFLIDLEEICYTGRHLSWMLAVGVPQLMLHVVGLPAVGFYMLYRNRHKLEHPVVRARYGLFLGGYKRNRYYWEVVVIMRKVSVVALSIFGTAISVEVQALMALLLICVCGVLQLAGRPFKVTKETIRNQYLVSLELAALLVIWLTMWGGVLMFQLNDAVPGDRIMKETVTVVICVMNGFLVLWMMRRYFTEIFNENKENGAIKFALKKSAGFKKKFKHDRVESRHSWSVATKAENLKTREFYEKRGHKSSGSGRVVFENPMDALQLAMEAENAQAGGSVCRCADGQVDLTHDEVIYLQAANLPTETLSTSTVRLILNATAAIIAAGGGGASGVSESSINSESKANTTSKAKTIKPNRRSLFGGQRRKLNAASRKKKEQVNKKKHHTRKSTQLPVGWDKARTGDGTR